MTLSELLTTLQPTKNLCVTIYSGNDTENFFYEGWCSDNRRVISWGINTEYNISVRVAKSALTNTERTYLGNIVKPFRDRVVQIVKYTTGHGFEYISIRMKSTEEVNLPEFPRGKYYGGMEANNGYTLEELGI